MIVKETASWGRRIAAATGALALGLAGLVGLSTAATAADGPGQPGAPTTGSLTIHKYAGTPTGQANDGSLLSPSPALPALAGVEFQIRSVTAIDGAPVDLNTPGGWEVVADLGNTIPAAGDLTFGATDVTVTTGADGSITQSGLPIGLYYVTEAGPGPHEITTVAEPFLVTLPLPQGSAGWLYDVHVYPKNTITSAATKTVDDSAAFVLGDDVSWTIQTPALSVNQSAQITTFVVTDDLPAQLEFVAGSVTAVSINGGVETPISDPNFTSYFTVGYTPAGPGGVLTITATSPAGLAYLNSLPTSARLAFTFDTTVVAVGTIVNEGTVSIGGTPFSGTASTGWGSALITKTDASSDELLAGAVFSVFIADGDGLPTGTAVLTGITSDDDGEFLIAGLKAGDYVLVETAAPAGYVLPVGTAAQTQFTIAAGTTVVEIDVENTQQSVPALPLTGANGQLLMTLAGIALLLVAIGGALAVRNRSKHAE